MNLATNCLLGWLDPTNPNRHVERVLSVDPKAGWAFLIDVNSTKGVPVKKSLED